MVILKPYTRGVECVVLRVSVLKLNVVLIG